MHAPLDFVARGSVRRDAPLPPGEPLLRGVEAWLVRHHPALLVSRSHHAGRDDAAVLVVQLHPIDRGLRITAWPRGRVEASALTYPVGPGFRVFVGRLMRRIGRALGIQWSTPPGISPTSASEAAQTSLAAEARSVIDQLAAGVTAPLLLLPPTHRFDHDGLVATPLGPRDMQWLAGAAVGALRLDDAFAWPTPGLSPRAAKGRALTLLWTEVRWRPPEDAFEEHVFAEVDRLLTEAHTGEPNLDLPWAEWAEVQTLAGLRTELSEVVFHRCGTSTSWPPVGYRRRPVQVGLPEDWWVTVPGAFAERWEGDGTWVGWQKGRRLIARVHGEHSRPPTRPEMPDMVFREPQREGVAWLHTPRSGERGLRFSGVMSDGRTAVGLEADYQPGDRGWVERAWRSLVVANASPGSAALELR